MSTEFSYSSHKMFESSSKKLIKIKNLESIKLDFGHIGLFFEA